MPPTTTHLGSSSLEVQRLAFGCEQLGGHDWGDVDIAAIERAIDVAVSHGAMLFDTADCYGLGESERRLGRALRAHRDRALIATKFGVRFSDSGAIFYDSRAEWIDHALHASLQRLGTEVIDLYQMHYWDGSTPLAAVFDHLEVLRDQGKIRWYGLTNHLPQHFDASAYPGLVSVSLEYSLVHREHEHAARALAHRGLSFLSYGCLGQGVLSGKYGDEHRFPANDRRSRSSYVNFHGDRYQRNLLIVKAMQHWARQLDASTPQIALAWIFQRIPGSIALVGIKQPRHMSEALCALTLELPPAAVAELDVVSSGAAA
jgi:myo-inositol catabolism protein IolS